MKQDKTKLKVKTQFYALFLCVCERVCVCVGGSVKCDGGKKIAPPPIGKCTWCFPVWFLLYHFMKNDAQGIALVNNMLIAPREECLLISSISKCEKAKGVILPYQTHWSTNRPQDTLLSPLSLIQLIAFVKNSCLCDRCCHRLTNRQRWDLWPPKAQFKIVRKVDVWDEGVLEKFCLHCLFFTIR